MIIADVDQQPPAPAGDHQPASSGPVLEIVTRSLEDDKALDPVVVDLAGKTTIADHMVVATGTSQRHIASMAEKLLDRLKAEGLANYGAEGLEEGGSGWVLIDAGDVIVHLFRAETRAFYDIEKLWSVAPPKRAALVADGDAA